MYKPAFGKLINRTETPVPRIILITDSAEVCGRGVIFALVKSHVHAGSRVLYLTTTVSPRRIQTFIKEEDFAGKVLYYDGYSDPCGWENRESCVLLDSSLDSIFNVRTANGGSKCVVVIDKLDDLYNHQDPMKLIKNLHKFGTDENIEQLVIYCSRDCVAEHMSALSHIASATLHIQPATPCQCKIVLRKPSGKVVQSYEEFTLTPELRIHNNKIVEKDQVPKEESSDADVILAAQTTFNLSLTDDQRRSKNMLLLPHTRVQSSGGQIHYTPDDVDDWDEEDPDDDLNI